MLDCFPMRFPRLLGGVTATILLLGAFVTSRASFAQGNQEGHSHPAPPPAKELPAVDPAAIERAVTEGLANIRSVRDGFSSNVRTPDAAWVALEGILRARLNYMSALSEVVPLTRP